MTVKAYPDFYDQARELYEAAELYGSVAKDRDTLMSNRQSEAKMLEKTAWLTKLADALHALTGEAPAGSTATGVWPTRDELQASMKKAETLKYYSDRILSLPELKTLGPVRAECEQFPAHFTPPSGGPTLGVMTLIEATSEMGKRPLVQDGKVVGKTTPAAILAGKQKKLRAKSGDEAPEPSKAKSNSVNQATFDIFNNAYAVGWSNLEDLRLWFMSARGVNWLAGRLPPRKEYAPAARGVRRAYNPTLKVYGKLDRPAFADCSSRLVCIDIDNVIAAEGADLADPQQMAAVALSYLPEQFLGVEFLLAPSSGHGTPGKEGGSQIRLHLAFILAEALSGAQLSAWMATVQRMGKVGVDSSMFTATQPIYTNRPCLDAVTLRPVADPYAALEWVKIEGEALYVPVPEFESEEAIHHANDNAGGKPRTPRAPRPKPQKGEKVRMKRGGGGPCAGMTVAQTVAEFGDDRMGFNEPMKHLVAILSRDPAYNAEQILEVVSEAMLNADRSGREGNKAPEDYIEELPRMIARYMNGAAERGRTQAYGERFEAIEEDAQEAAVANVAPLPTASLEEAQAVAQYGLETWLTLHAEVPFGGWKEKPVERQCVFGFETFNEDDEELDEATVAALVDGRTAYVFAEAPDEAPDAEVEPAVVQTADSLDNALAGVLEVKASDLSAKEKADAIVEVIREQGLATARPSLVLKIGAGIGKTKTLIDHVNRATAEGDPRTFAFTFPEHGLAAESIAQVDGGAVYKGMDQVGMCYFREERQKMQLIGATPEGFCRTCPGKISSDPKERCGYWKQSETLKGAKALGFPHGLRVMAHPLPTPCKDAGLKVPDVLISDEGALAELIAEEFVALNDFFLDFGLFAPAKAYLTEEAKKNFVKTTVAYEAIEQWFEIVRHDFTQGATSEGVAMTVDRMRKLRPRFGPSLFASLLVRLEDCEGGMELANNKEAKKILEAWNAPLKRAQKLCAGLRAMDLRPGVGAPSDSMIVPGWSFSSKKITTSDGEGEFPGLSFSYRAGVSKEWSRTALILLDATVREEAKAILAPGAAVVSAVAREVAGAVTRHVRFTPSGNNSARHLPAYIDRWGRAMSALGSVGIVMAKETETAILKSYVAPDVPPYLLLHHGATRGRNAMEGCRIGAVFGRQLIAPEDRAVMVTALSGRPVKVGENADVAAAWSIRDGSGLGGARWGDTQGGLADDLARGAEDCVIQAEARFRAVRRTAADPLAAFVHVDRVVEGLTVDTVAGAVAERVSLGDETLVTDFVRVAAEIGFVPVGKSGARVFRQAFDLDAKAWENARLRFEGGPVTPHFPYVQEEESKQIENEGLRVPPLGEWLDGLADAAKATARQDAATKVLRVETVHGPATVVCLTDEATAVPGRMGLASEVLTGKARTKALRVRTDAAAPDTVADEAPAAADALPLAA